MIKKGILFLLALCLTASIFSGCTPSSGEVNRQNTDDSEEGVTSQNDKTQLTESGNDEKSTKTRTIVDHFGFEVEIPEKIDRVVIVWLLPLPSVLAIYQGGNVDNLVGMPPDSLNAAQNSILARYSPDILNVSTDFYEGGELNMEELISLNPDVVFYSGAQRAELFQNAGIPAVGFSTVLDGNPSPIHSLNKWIELLEDVFQQESKTKGIAEYAANAEAEITKRVSAIPEEDRKKVLMIGHYTDTAITPGGEGSFSQYWCEAVGAVCVAAQVSESEVNMEQIYEWNPDIVFLSTLAQFYPDDLYNNTAGTGHDWSTVLAVQNKQVYKFPLGTHRWWPPSSDAPLSLWWVAKHTYPQLFEDINMEQKTKEYYLEFYGMELSDEEVEWILNPSENLGRKYS